MSLGINLCDKVTERKTEIYVKQIEKTLERLTKVLDTKDQDYINQYVLKVLETSFHRGYLPQKDIPLVAKILNVKIKYDRLPKNETVKKNRDWNNTLDHIINFKIDICAICEAKLHNQGKFPKGYPDKWKLCCNHRDVLYAGLGLNIKSSEQIKTFIQYKDKFEELFSLKCP